jgi:hypothetical protein
VSTTLIFGDEPCQVLKLFHQFGKLQFPSSGCNTFIVVLVYHQHHQ